MGLWTELFISDPTQFGIPPALIEGIYIFVVRSESDVGLRILSFTGIAILIGF